MTDGAEETGRWQIVVMVIASGVNDLQGMLSLILHIWQGSGTLNINQFEHILP